MSPSQILMNEGLLDWHAVSVGFRRGWMSAGEVAELAVIEIVRQDAPSSELVELTGAQDLAANDIQDLLNALEGPEPDIDSDAAARHWLLAHLVQLDQSVLAEHVLTDRLQEIYAEFGFPEEMRPLSPYNFASGEPTEIGENAVPILEQLGAVISDLRLKV